MVVLFEERQPACDVHGMAQLALHAEMRAQKRRAQLGNEILCGVRLCAEAILEIPLQSLLPTTPVNELVKFRCLDSNSKCNFV
jgi:hypothetical protein